ncbi:hypothetical protein M0R45_005722 [Rubus argutus]|uniref:Pentatricopeptide repeat-containing protein n=1 Tax=Rubus argutus TaxID=59490 RepID=A0AAW1YNL2_RUBAR
MVEFGISLVFMISMSFLIKLSGFELSAKTCSILMRGWGDIMDSDEVHKLFDEMTERGCLVDVPAYDSYLEALRKGGNLDEAYKIFQEMDSNGIDPDACTYSIFIRAYCEANDIHSVFRVLHKMRRYNRLPNVCSYNCIIKKLCKNEVAAYWNTSSEESLAVPKY